MKLADFKQFIEIEFSHAGYQALGFDLWMNNRQSDFWLIINLAGEYQLEVIQDQLCADLAEFYNRYSMMEKNTSLLILNQVAHASYKNLEKVIADENDPYHFKKYIIQYTAEEWESAKAHLPENVSLSYVLMDSSVFDELKAENGNGPISLLYSIAHKFPFVMLPVQSKDFIYKDNLFYKNNVEIELDKWLDTIRTKEEIGFKIDEFLNITTHE